MAKTSYTRGRLSAGRSTGSRLLVSAVGLLLAALMPAYAEVRNPDGVAVIIGNKSYDHERVPEVSYAHRDANAFKQYVLEVLGYDEENVIDLRDASQAELFTVFGNERRHEGTTLWSYLHPHGSDVVVYYSGHGVPGLHDGRGYLLPRDADPNTAEINGYPLDVLYANLAKLEEARSVTVYVDACFSGDSHEGMLVRSASPVYVAAELPEAPGVKLTVLTAASGEQLASWDEAAGHGLFTHHLLDALYGKADEDGDGQVTAGEAVDYLLGHMTRAARRVHKRRQEPTLNGSAEVVLSRAADGVFASRPTIGAADLETEPEQASQPPTPTDTDDRARQRGLLLVGIRSAYDAGAYDGVLKFVAKLQQLGEELPEEAEHYRSQAELLIAGRRFRDCEGCPAMIVVPAGSFVMGSPSHEAGRFANEGPQHLVRIDGPFAVGVYEVTFAEWDFCVSRGGCAGYRPPDRWNWGRGLRPVMNVSWHDAQTYVRWLSEHTEEEYRLLSEAEWEYVARAGTTAPYHFGTTMSPSQANFSPAVSDVLGAKTKPVGSYEANRFGLYDVHGNVYEMVQDCLNLDYHGAPSDGSAWESGDCGRRIVRGGWWSFDGRSPRSALRVSIESGLRDPGYGFRVARMLRR